MTTGDQQRFQSCSYSPELGVALVAELEIARHAFGATTWDVAILAISENARVSA